MILNFISWSPFISFMAIAMLYPIKIHPRSFYITRTYAAALLFPGLLSGIYELKLTILNGSIINNLSRISKSPIFWGLQLNAANSLITLGAIISLAFLIFFLPKLNYTENISIISAYMLALLLICCSADKLISLTVFMIASIATTYIFVETKKCSTGQILNEFILQRACDFICLVAIIKILTATNQGGFGQFTPIYMAELVFLFSFIARILLAAFLQPDQDSSRQHIASRWLLINIGCPLIIMPFSSAVSNLSFISLTTISMLLIIAFALASIIKKDLFLLLPLSILLLIITNSTSALAIIISISITPITYILLTGATSDKTTLVTNKYFTDTRLFKLLSILPSSLNTLYSGFLLYRLPQMIITLIQLPLRLFHNGNIQRSMMFTSIVLVSYFFFWWKR